MTVIFNYNNIFFSFFYDDESGCIHRSHEYAMNYVDRHRAELEKKYSKFEEFQKKFEVTDEMVEEIVAEGEKQGVKKDEALLGPVMPELRLFVKSLLARDLWGMTELYRVSNESNKILNEAVKVLQDGSYDNLLN